MSRTPRKGDIWKWISTDPAHYLLLKRADNGEDWWEALELETGEFFDVPLSWKSSYWQFIS